MEPGKPSSFMSSKFWSKLIFVFLFAYLVIFFWTNKNIYLQKYDYPSWQNRYDQSQYAQGDKSSYILSDSDLNTLRGYLYLNKGIDMEKFIPGHPPLASYLFGISIAVFNNQYVISLIFGVLCLFVFYKVCFLLTRHELVSLIITLLLSLEPIYRNQLNDSMLDIFQLTFGLTALYYFLVWLKKGKISPLLISQIFIGFTISTKFFISGASLPIALAVSTVFLNNFGKFKQYILSLPFVGLGYLIGHLTYFFYHPSLISFIKYQRYIINWWFGSPQTPPLKVWDLIFFNRWHVWWGDTAVISTGEWRITWPVVISLSLLSIFLFLTKKITSKYYLPVFLWLFFSLLLYSFEAVYPRHLLFIFPAAYLLSSLAIIKLRCPKC